MQDLPHQPRPDVVIEAIAFIGLYPTVTAFIEAHPKCFRQDESIRLNLIERYRQLEHIRAVGLANNYKDVPPKQNKMCVAIIEAEIKT